MKPLITLQEAAKILRCSTDTLRRAIKKNEITSHRIGGIVFRESDLNAFLEKTKYSDREKRTAGRPKGGGS